jgi:hypothetical protein
MLLPIARLSEQYSEASVQQNTIRVIASFTTVPSRVHLLRPMILSVLNQSYAVAAVELNMPYFNQRTQENYTIPSWLLNISDRLHIYRTPDYGAITKVAPTLVRHMGENNTYIWSLDDDRVFPSHILELLMQNIDRANPAMLGFVGGTMRWGGNISPPKPPNDHHAVGVLKGYGTILYPPGCIHEDFQAYVNMTSEHLDARNSDDVILANYFAHYPVPRYTVPFPEGQMVLFNGPGVELRYNRDKTALHRTDGGHPNRYKAVLLWLQEQGMLWLPVQGSQPREKKQKKSLDLKRKSNNKRETTRN